VALVCEAREADDHAARVVAPIRGEEPGERGNEGHAARIVDGSRELLDLGRVVDEAQVVPQPLDERASHGDRALERVHRVGVAELPGDGGDQSKARTRRHSRTGEQLLAAMKATVRDDRRRER